MPRAHVLAVFAVLAVVAAIAPAPASTDRGFYEQLGREIIIRDCADIHCFRPLVAAVLEHLPGPSLPKWKGYAVIANGIGALAVGQLCLLLGLSRSSAIAATWLSALGTGSLYSLFDCYTSDPLMYMLGPILAIQLWRGRTARAGWIAAAGVLAKEFAAAPLWIFTAFAAFSRRWPPAARLLLAATAVTIVWLSKQAGLMVFQNYRYGFTASDDLLHGGYAATWLAHVGWSASAVYLFSAFGALYVLLPAGLLRAGRDVRLLAVATLPAALAFLYVEQPERALWNFHFIVIPVAMAALEGAPAWMVSLLVASCGVVGLRFGAQLDIRLAARLALAISLVIAVVTAAVTVSRRQNVTQGFTSAGAPPRRFWFVAAGEGAALVLLGVIMWDVHLHRRDETILGFNQWGFRGPLQTARPSGVRVAVVGGRAAFDAGTPWWETMPARLASALNEASGGTTNRVDNLAEPGAGARSYVATLRDYAYLHPEVVCVLDGYDAVGDVPPRGRRASLVYRATGYLPIVPSALLRRPRPLSDPETAMAPVLREGPFNPVLDPSCSGASASYCLAMIDTVRYALERRYAVVVATPPYASPRHQAQQQSLAEHLAREFHDQPGFGYVDLGAVVDRRAQAEQLASAIRRVRPVK